MATSGEEPFNELPEAMVEDLLDQCEELGDRLSESFRTLSQSREESREDLIEEELLREDTELISTPSYPTTCGVDGSYAIERLLSMDMVAIAAIAIEGLTPPTEESHWPKPHHYSEVLPARHSDATGLVARAAMMCMELELAANAPHNVVFLDGSLTTPFIYLNQALNQIDSVDERLAAILREWFESAMDAYKMILSSKRTDKAFVGVPKYTTRREITNRFLESDDYEDRGFLSFILKPGEFIGPVSLEKPDRPWHIDRPPTAIAEIIEEIIAKLNELQVVYYRPYHHSPALRLECSRSIVSNTQQFAAMLEALQIQGSVQGLMEPYPLYLADRMVKHLGTALPAIRRTMTQEMTVDWEEELGNMHLAMHGYRTELGRGD